MARIYESADLLATAIKQARETAGLTQDQLAEELGTSVGTVKRWEAGEEASLGRTPNARRSIAVQVVEATGAPRDLLGLPAAGPDRGRTTEQRVGVLELQMRAVLDILEEQEPGEIAELREAAAAVARQYDSSTHAREEPGSAAESG